MTDADLIATALRRASVLIATTADRPDADPTNANIATGVSAMLLVVAREVDTLAALHDEEMDRAYDRLRDEWGI